MDCRIYNRMMKNLVAGTDTKVPLEDGRLVTSINFDNAATTPPFLSVLQEIYNFSPLYSSIHRGTGYKSRISSDIFERSRQVVLDFANADAEKYTVIFVKNTTEALNKLSNRLCDDGKKNVVLSTTMEHHSNDLPWRSKYRVDYIDIDKSGRLSLEDLKSKLERYRGNVRLVTVTGASNVTGYINPIHEIASIVHSYGSEICVDGAQLVPHVPFYMQPKGRGEHIDYLAFSAHKMYAPFGTGVLIGLKETFKLGNPDYSGGGTVKIVTPEIVIWEDPPHKDEAGTPNVMGVVALSASIRTLNMIGMQNIKEYEACITQYALDGLRNIPGIVLYGDKSGSYGRVGIISFNIDGIYHNQLAKILADETGIAVRNGCFCAQPYIQRLLKISREQLLEHINDPGFPRPGMVRISFGIYNTVDEIDSLVRILLRITENKEYYIRKYEKFV